MSFKDPIALALVRRSDGQLLTLQGFLKVDLPATAVLPAASATHLLAKKLASLGVFIHPELLVFRWQAVVGWGGDNPRPIYVYDARSLWSGTPIEMCGWSTEEEISRGQRTEVYKRLFAKLREGGAPSKDTNGVIRELPVQKPSKHPCPKCNAGLNLRNRRPGEEVRYDCFACASSFGLLNGALERIAPIAG